MSAARIEHPSRAPRIVALLNPVVRRLMRAGIPLGPNVELTVRGRASGLPRTFPVALIETGGRMFIQSPYGEVNWVLNLRADGSATLARGKRTRAVEALELAPEAAEPILRAALEPYRRSPLMAAVARVFVPIRSDATADEYAEHVRRHPMFELVPRPGDR